MKQVFVSPTQPLDCGVKVQTKYGKAWWYIDDYYGLGGVYMYSAFLTNTKRVVHRQIFYRSIRRVLTEHGDNCKAVFK